MVYCYALFLFFYLILVFGVLQSHPILGPAQSARNHSFITVTPPRTTTVTLFLGEEYMLFRSSQIVM